MFPYLKLAKTIFKSKLRRKIDIEDKSTLKLRAGLTDIDLFMELNNARYFNYMELGRWDFSFRTGLSEVIRENKWGAAVGGASIRYRRRIPFLSRFFLTTKLICHDGRWLYFLQETHMKNKICSSALIKFGMTSKGKLVPSDEVMKKAGRENWKAELPEWVKSWNEAEGQRPWPKSA